MVAFSCLGLRGAQLILRSLSKPLCGNSACVSNVLQGSNGSIRCMGGGHGNKMIIKPSTFEYTKWKDHVHLYAALGLIPMAILITGVNLFVGRAELADIPEGYEPKHWEYHQHPISRWFARYVYDNPQKDYEKMLHLINQENQKRKLRLLETRVRELMSTRGDYKGWYYMPVNERKVYLARQVEQDRDRNSGTS